ncbi:hypothetical protein EJ05DRAFT_473022 [Pseudovirgaria hyperparasitica]|uniref:Zn(2)-C6 fungal-type domain-containing protein n=1 Tax=Pseudovirgaria hyperparasitica TaxID=470096 RepID=A0A6A6WK18_9PEZI|nr:uncharacterized protein EJ05DRAFT_473022 [Pseudovirgaria hyperparasitica]KAF2762091.1 hypothetical protein EJ05DRAFT_473022 [Pseudovirgaria hyperparasitica]
MSTSNASTATQTLDPPPAKETSQAQAQATVPRKRRRRAPASGAAEDCFTCRKRQTKCDRRRPYCTQCIELGKECSGYRTTLTWGVGVASRGKLRGMSLPVPKSPSKNDSTSKETKITKTAASKSTVSTPSVFTPAPAASRQSPDFNHYASAPTTNHIVSNAQDYFAVNATSPIPIPTASAQQMNWHVQANPFDFNEKVLSSNHLQSRPQIGRIYTSISSYDTISASTGSISAYSDRDYPSPSDFSQPDDFSYTDSHIPSYPGVYISEPHSYESLSRQTSYGLTSDAMSSSMSSDQSQHDFLDSAGIHGSYSSAGGDFVKFEPIYEHDLQHSMDMVPQHSPTSYYQQMENLLVDSLAGESGVFPPNTAPFLTIPRSVLPHQIYQLSPRLRFLLDYYDKAICPVLVAFDGPTNPYRMHVMHLAMEDEGLMNAIAALSTNNIRMRGGTNMKRLGYDQTSCSSPGGSQSILPDSAYASVSAQEMRDFQGEATQEELRYKALSIEVLNQQLADPSQAKNDSVLATLLVLCLFHVCDSGFSKFKTQLAGVQKLLSLRDRSHQSNFVGWIEVFFTWFDVMNSCVNERETEVRPESLDMLNLSTNLGALEHLVGCEGRLFKLIARLGRLNLLSQNRPVRGSDATPRPSPQPRRAKDYYSLTFDNLDGNGWGPLVSDWDDGRSDFWLEWQYVRERLQEWELHTAPPSQQQSHASSPPVAAMCAVVAPITLDAPQRDLLHISESFRYAALLYIERLANPDLPSSAMVFQNLVAQALYHISHIGITSCVNKFLLWPLFIAGTECVDEHHRAIVRQRCVEIQRESGFFNNLSGLEVLERTWKQDYMPASGGPFKWRAVMDKVDGEYVLV